MNDDMAFYYIIGIGSSSSFTTHISDYSATRTVSTLDEELFEVYDVKTPYVNNEYVSAGLSKLTNSAST